MSPIMAYLVTDVNPIANRLLKLLCILSRNFSPAGANLTEVYISNLCTQDDKRLLHIAPEQVFSKR